MSAPPRSSFPLSRFVHPIPPLIPIYPPPPASALPFSHVLLSSLDSHLHLHLPRLSLSLSVSCSGFLSGLTCPTRCTYIHTSIHVVHMFTYSRIQTPCLAHIHAPRNERPRAALFALLFTVDLGDSASADVDAAGLSPRFDWGTHLHHPLA